MLKHSRPVGQQQAALLVEQELVQRRELVHGR